MTVSSTEGEADLGVAEADTQDVSIAESSDASEGAGSLVDAVSAALKGPEATPASDEPGSEEPVSDSTEEDDLSPEEVSKLSERTQRRFRELVEQRRNAEGQAVEVQQELDALKPKAARMDELTGYMQTHAITSQHLNNALGLVATINRGDFDTALPILENLVEQVRRQAGDVLPADLLQQVNTGYLTEAHAKELHKSRLREARTRETAARDRERHDNERRQQETQTAVQHVVQTADTWSKEQATKDPDWNLKRDRVTEKVELAIGRQLREKGPEGFPRTGEAVRAMLDQIKKDVEAEFRKFRPSPTPIDPSPTGGSASPRSKAKPASLMDAVNGALAD